MIWNLCNTDKYDRSFKQYQKKHRDELQGVLMNLFDYKTAVDSGVDPLRVQAGFIHPETMGIVAIDQKRGGIRKKLKQMRLYLYPDKEKCEIWLITIGDKNTQKADIQLAKDFVKEIRANNS